MKEHFLAASEQGKTLFREEAGRIWLSRLFGMACGWGDKDGHSVRAQGLTVLSASVGRFEGPSLHATEVAFSGDAGRIVWQAGEGAFRIESRWAICPETGVISRKDRLTNTGASSSTIFRCLARFVFPPARYHVFSQDSRWCSENQGAWAPLSAAGGILLGCEWGRTTQGGTPYACLREAGADTGVAFHVLPQGNWVIRLASRVTGPGLPCVVVEAGLADEDLRLELGPGEAVDLPEILLQALLGGDPQRAAPALHQYALARYGAPKSPMPVVYNTWFDQFDRLEPPRLLRQLASARAIGCEVFVVDAGWYGAAAGDWSLLVGDWREKEDGVFAGRMKEFADHVRAAGMGFGLWMEPERFGPQVPARNEHPDWFIPTAHGLARINLENESAYDYVRNEADRLITTYKLAWLKLDFNAGLGCDPSGAELSRYYRAWYRLLDEMRRRHPETFFEGCASGGMRLELESLSHCDGQFLTDTVNPVHVLRIAEGALLRLPAGRLARWAVLRSAGKSIPECGRTVADSPTAVLTPGGATWDPSETVSVDFAALAAMPGIMGLSGDLDGLPTEAKERLREWVTFFRQWRAFIAGSVAHLLTAPRPRDDRNGWSALQLLSPDGRTSLLFAYRLDDARRRRRVPLRGLAHNALYAVTKWSPAQGPGEIVSGAELMTEGLPVEVAARLNAAVYSVQVHRNG